MAVTQCGAGRVLFCRSRLLLVLHSEICKCASGVVVREGRREGDQGWVGEEGEHGWGVDRGTYGGARYLGRFCRREICACACLDPARAGPLTRIKAVPTKPLTNATCFSEPFATHVREDTASLPDELQITAQGSTGGGRAKIRGRGPLDGFWTSRMPFWDTGRSN